MRTASLYPLDLEAILLCHQTFRLFYLNSSATLLWTCMEHGQEPDEVARAIAAHFGISISVARRDIYSLLSDWEREGLRPAGPSGAVDRDTSDTETDVRGDLDATEASGGLATKCNVGPIPQPTRQSAESISALGSTRTAAKGDLGDWYAIGAVTLRIVHHTGRSKELVHPIFEHLVSSPSNSRGNTLVTLEIREEQKGFSLTVNGSDTQHCLHPQQVPPAVQAEVLRATFNASEPLVGIHAAALATPNGCVLLPGAPGSGKSTLTAALMAEGYTYLTDELVLVMPRTHVVRPLPVSLGLKRGSWGALVGTFPTIETLPSFRQLDGTEVRYLTPVRRGSQSEIDYYARTLVFPMYDPTGKNEFSEISTAVALYRLAAAGYALSGRLEHSTVEELLEWIRPLSCYELRMHSLGEAVSAINGLMA